MRILLHTCCGPCLLYPYDFLIENGYEITGYFYNPNIHPYREFRRRLDSLISLSEDDNISLITERDYDINSYLHRVVFNEDNRCQHCYELRLEQTVRFAKENNYDMFSTTLLYSRYQKHQQLIKICEDLSNRYDINFYYHDFREGWQIGIDRSVDKELYRQAYCGCIYSEQERYDNRLKKKLRKMRKG